MSFIQLVYSDLLRINGDQVTFPLKAFFSNSFRAIFLIRLATTRSSSTWVLAMLSKWLLKNIFCIEINRECHIGAGLFLPHPRDIIIGSHNIGCNCTIMHGVTLGSDTIDFGINCGSRPKVGEECFLGINSVILGAGSLKNNTVVKPNSFLHLKKR